MNVATTPWDELNELKTAMNKCLSPWQRSGAAWVRRNLLTGSPPSLGVEVPRELKVSAEVAENPNIKTPRDVENMQKADEKLRKAGYTLIDKWTAPPTREQSEEAKEEQEASQ